MVHILLLFGRLAIKRKILILNAHLKIRTSMQSTRFLEANNVLSKFEFSCQCKKRLFIILLC